MSSASPTGKGTSPESADVHAPAQLAEDIEAVYDELTDGRRRPLRVAELEMVVDPAAEWKQMFADAYRFERDFFYDPNLHGVDWKATRDRYAKLIDASVTRWDVNFVLGAGAWGWPLGFAAAALALHLRRPRATTSPPVRIGAGFAFGRLL